MKLIIAFYLLLSLLILNQRCLADSYIVVQGLGNKFEVMSDLVEELKSRGHKVFKMSLKGHSLHDYEELKHITANKWKEQLVDVYNTLPQDDKKHFLGYSLGGAVGIKTISEESDIIFDSAVFLAPAVAIQPYAHIVNFFKIIGIKSLFSLAPEKERAYRFTPMQTYDALFQVEKDIHRVNSDKLNKMKVTIIMDSWDMLVSYSGVKKWLANNELKNWKLKKVIVPRGVRHMLTQKEFLPEESWRVIVNLF